MATKEQSYKLRKMKKVEEQAKYIASVMTADEFNTPLPELVKKYMPNGIPKKYVGRVHQ